MTAAIPSTYVLDAETSATISRLAKLWNQPETEVIKRAVKAAEPIKSNQEEIEKRLAAWRELQGSLASRRVDFDEWKQVVHESRQ